MKRLQPSDAWARAGLEAFLHADTHARSGDAADLRHCVVGYDGAIEGVIAGYLREGPGTVDTRPLAVKARAPRSSFWDKSRWLADESGFDVACSASDMNAVRSARNEIQHGGTWWVPPIDVAESAELIAVAILGTLLGHDALRDARGAQQPSQLPEATSHRLLGPRPDVVTGQGEGSPSGLLETPERRPVVAAAWRLAQSIDPDEAGVHYRHLALRLVETGEYDFGQREAAGVVYDALNHAHDRFTRVVGAAGVFRWMDPVDRDPALGLRSTALADAAYAAAMFLDPDHCGVHYNRDIVAILRRWGVPIRGVDVGATVNHAMRTDPRFEKVAGARGVYRWSQPPRPT